MPLAPASAQEPVATAAKPPPAIALVLYPDPPSPDSLSPPLLATRDALRGDRRLEVLLYNPESPTFVLGARRAGLTLDPATAATPDQRKAMTEAVGANFLAVLSRHGRRSKSVDVALYELAPVAQTWSYLDREPASVAGEIASQIEAASALAAPAIAPQVAPATAARPVPPVLPAPPAAPLDTAPQVPATRHDVPVPVTPPVGSPVPAVTAPPVVAPPTPSVVIAPNPPVVKTPPTVVPTPSVLAPRVVTPPVILSAPAVPAAAPKPTPVAPPPPPVTLPVPARPASPRTVPAAAAPLAVPVLAPAPVVPAPPVVSPLPAALPQPPIIIPEAPATSAPAASNPAPAASLPAGPPPGTVISDEARRLITEGDQQQRSSDYDAAIETYRQAINLAPRAAEPRLRLAQAFLQAGMRDQAINEARRALVMDPSSQDARDFLTTLGASDSDATQIPANQAVVTANPKDQTAWIALGDSCWNANKVPDALAAYRRAVDLDPAAVAPHARLARLYAAQGEYKQSLTALDKAGTDGYPYALEIIASETENLLGEIDAAEELFERGDNTREQCYKRLQATDKAAQGLADFVAKVTAPSAYKLSHLHRQLSTRLLAQDTAGWISYAETGEVRYKSIALTLEKEAVREMETAAAAERARSSGASR